MSGKLYSYKNDELRKDIPKEHLHVTDPKKQRIKAKEFFEENIHIWDKAYENEEPDPYRHNLTALKKALGKYPRGLKLLDAGCGTGVPLIEFLKMGFDAYGFDFTHSGITRTHMKLMFAGYTENRAWIADMEKPETLPKEKYDIIVSVGAFLHLVDEAGALRNLAQILNDDGTVFIQFRNDLFNMFALNAYSIDYYKRLVHFDTLPKELKKEVENFWAKRFNAPGINAEFSIISKFHNPLNIGASLFEPAGFKIKNIHFFHFHPLPPNLELKNKATFRALGDAIENPHDWRGHFVASSFIVEAEKAR